MDGGETKEKFCRACKGAVGTEFNLEFGCGKIREC